MINLIISGKVGRDAKELENGCVFPLATTKKGYTNKEGKVFEDKTIWFSVFAHKNLAKHIQKGDSLTVYTDDINTEVYEGKVNLSCRSLSLEFGGKSKGNNEQNNAPEAEESNDLPF